MVTRSVSQKGKVRVTLGPRSSPVSAILVRAQVWSSAHLIKDSLLPSQWSAARTRFRLSLVILWGNTYVFLKCLLHMLYSGRPRVL